MSEHERPPAQPWLQQPQQLVVPRPGPMSQQAQEYQQLLRGPRRRWWRPLLGALLFGVFAFVMINLLGVILIIGGVVAGIDDPVIWANDILSQTTTMGPLTFALTLASLIVLIPAAMWSIWIAHGVRPQFLASVAGGIRWRWLLRCVAISLPIWVAYLGISLLISPGDGVRPQYWWLILIMAVLFVPFQAAGEEYAFRGWMLQNVGAWFSHRWLSLIVPLVISVIVFALAHGSTNIWVLADLGFFALTATVLTWRTGGLEAGIALHAVNNVSLFVVVLIFGGWQDAFVSGDTTSTPGAFLITAAVETLAAALILWQAKKHGIQRTFQPKAMPPVLPVPNGWPTWPAEPSVAPPAGPSVAEWATEAPPVPRRAK